jgi:hypothetical protein
MGDLVVPDEHPTRVCDVCGGVDSHPRHILAGGDKGSFPHVHEHAVAAVLANDALTADEKAHHVADLVDTTAQYRHYDCCRSVGCPTGTCDVLTVGAEDLRGAELRDHIGTHEPFTIGLEG